MSFFKTKAGGLTAAFIVIMCAFCLVMAGLKNGSDTMCRTGFLLIMAAILYSPVRVYIMKK